MAAGRARAGLVRLTQGGAFNSCAARGPQSRDQGRALGGWRPEDWEIVVPGQLHSQVCPRNLLCRRPAQLEQKSLGVSAPRLPALPPGWRAPHIPERAGS